MDKKLSILRVVFNVSPTSAPYNQFSLPVCNKHEITLLSFAPIEVDIPESIRTLRSDGTTRRFMRSLIGIIRERYFDVVHVHAPHVGIFFILAALFFNRGLLSRAVYTVHSSLYSMKTRNKVFLLFNLFFFRRIVFCSQSSYESFPAWVRWLVRKKYKVITNGVDIDRVDRTRQHRMTSNNEDALFEVISVGRLTNGKDPLTVLRAFASIQSGKDRLVFIGDGPLLDQVRSEAKELGILDNIVFTGLIPRDQVYTKLQDASLFVSASHSEGMPVAVLEAMAAMCPVLLSDIPSHREVSIRTNCAVLIKPSDAASLAQAMKRYREMGRDARDMIGRQCREVVVRHFSLQAMLEAYEATFIQLSYDSARGK